MAVYPVSQGGLKATFNVEPDAGIVHTPMSDGTLRGFSDYTEAVVLVTITHFWLAAVDRDAIWTFYDANKLVTNSIDGDEDDYDAFFVNRPRVIEKSGPYSIMQSVLRGTIQ